MPFDPRDFLVVAQNLALSPSEASLRTAVGRAYYAIAMAAWVHMYGTSPVKVNHRKIEKASQKAGTTARDQFKALLRLRVEADYYTIPSDPSLADWQHNWEQAEGNAAALLPKIPRFVRR